MTAAKVRKVLITGAAQGIGRETALRMASAGFQVIASDVNQEKLSDLQGKENIRTERLDVLSRADMDDLVARIGTVDVLFNCAGVVHNGTIQECSRAELDFAWQLNVGAQFELIQAVLPGMLAQQDGCIINMSSVASSVKAVPNRFAYSATKAAVIGLTKSVAADYITQGIRCNAICPGTVDSPSLQERLHAQGDYEAARKAFIARQPIGRIGKLDEIAELVLYLANATFTTGHIHIIDGGWAA
ncbi:2-keto-3-deoxy-L-fuconate dehydrogenase [Paramixta manurensis]|uniref:2-keto-3-deoxy-L-fuconate dehydrogenase n=1 Tax=Paramixta manurensis TaxID=2740817 RepID=A0A6M8U9T6_9GAMM|nr:2-keto-3-deoxy-L-fuconate dehydrogenase [Erwiniaceae bacterium PD-1]